MSDFERILDQFMLDMADTPERKKYAEGFIDGKRFAYKSVAYSFGFVAVVILIITLVAFL